MIVAFQNFFKIKKQTNNVVTYCEPVSASLPLPGPAADPRVTLLTRPPAHLAGRPSAQYPGLCAQRPLTDDLLQILFTTIRPAKRTIIADIKV